jgi:RNA polymerase sigma factor (sigma-70 family)
MKLRDYAMVSATIGSNIRPLTKENQEFVVKHKRLADKIAYSYAGKHHCDVDDAKQVAAMGLMKASQKYDPSMGYAPSTYVSHWILSYLQRYTVNGVTRGVKTPERIKRARTYVYLRSQKYFQKQGRHPSREEKMDWLLNDYLNKMGKKAAEYVLDARTVVSGDGPAHNGNDSGTLMDTIRDDSIKDTSEVLGDVEGISFVTDVVRSCLSKREYAIFVRRYELDGHDKMTLDQIGQELNLSHERTRQINIQAFEKVSKAMNYAMSLPTIKENKSSPNTEIFRVRHPVKKRRVLARINKVNPYLLEDDKDAAESYVLMVGKRKMIFSKEEMDAIERAVYLRHKQK